MRNLHPKVIAITGSYGKTSTKYILNSMLSQKFNVLMTPDSYNTPMGICKVIRGQLEPEHEIFIVEMGAYQRGDIRELCRLVYPEIGILTAVGAQHLERFKNIENIARTKYELIESLPQDGIAVFNDDNEICSELANKTTIKMARYAVDRLDEKVELTARKIENTRRGLTFIIEKSSGETCKVETKLLGRNNVYNILAATAVALECGVTLDNVSHATKLLEPIPHRLQLISGAGGVTVVDDGFNANPVGARAALEVLEGFSDGRKILVTPGMVELGDMEFDENKTFGAEAAKVCEFVILVGPIQTKPILEGLRTAGFPKEKILLVENLTQASESLTNIIKSGDVVLFENDLPDSYSEGS
jgi:UDP-N-acetylmuramoyl-tripeptide--D-alanyl-D-alanine ligase